MLNALIELVTITREGKRIRSWMPVSPERSRLGCRAPTSVSHDIAARGCSDSSEYHVDVSKFSGHVLLILELYEILPINRGDFEFFRSASQLLQIGE